MRARGFTGIELLIYAAVAAALVAAVWGAIAWHASTHYQRGYDKAQLEQKEANEAAARKQAADKAEYDKIVKAKSKEVEDARAARDEFHDKWQAAVASGRRSGTALVACPKPRPSPGPADAPREIAGGGDPVGGDVPRLTWQFVLDYDGAWQGAGGKPLFDHRPQLAAAAIAPGAASPYRAEDVVDNHGENARRHTACIQALTALNATIDQLEAAWDARNAVKE